MLLAFGDISFQNLANGTLRVSKLDPSEAAARIGAAVAEDSLVGLFEFGAVPSKSRQRHFEEILTALADFHGVVVPPRAFFSKVGPDGRLAAIPWNFLPMGPGNPIVLVQYTLSMWEPTEPDGEEEPVPSTDAEGVGDQIEQAEIATGEKGAEKDARPTFDDFFKSSVNGDLLEFHLIEMLSSEE